MNTPPFFRVLTVVFAVGFWSGPVWAETVSPAPAPDWTLQDVDGKTVSFSSFKGKVVVLDFWATWCPPCRSEIPGYIKLQEKYQDKGLVIIGVSVDQGEVAGVKKFTADFHMNYPVVLADADIVQALGGIESIPTTFIIDREGKIRDKKVGAMETADYEQVLKKYLD